MEVEGAEGEVAGASEGMVFGLSFGSLVEHLAQTRNIASHNRLQVLNSRIVGLANLK